MTHSILLAREISQKRPSDQIRDDLCNSPIDGQYGKKILMRAGEKFKENLRIYQHGNKSRTISRG
jgi:hypothetical protein